ncbi:MAG: lysophospholipid acyltransferase family protein [Desulfovibrio sp.]|uniref:lysophospholipid acyltransferase family protein n=1 Tax=Desulfovibrio sp. 7SRBS1 TaxID=3378064 RepID=UPI003B3D8630
MLRNIIFYLIAIPSTLFFSTLAIIHPAWGTPIMRIWGRSVLFAAGTKFHVDIQGLDPNQTYVFIGNHQSNLDIPFLSYFLNDYGVRFISKESVFKIPFFGPASKRVGHVAIDRSNRRKAMRSIEEAVEKIRSGTSLIIFPEGTRATEYDELQKFKSGAMILALKTGVPVVPFVMRSTGEILGKGSGWVKSRRLELRTLPPIDAANLYSLKDREKFKDDLYAMMNAAYKELPHG